MRLNLAVVLHEPRQVRPILTPLPQGVTPLPTGLIHDSFWRRTIVLLSRNEVKAKHLRFFVAEFILSNVEGLLRYHTYPSPRGLNARQFLDRWEDEG